MENTDKKFLFWESDPDVQLLVFRLSDYVSPHLQKRENISASPSTHAPFICLLCLCIILRTKPVPCMHDTYTGSTYTVLACSLQVLLWKNFPHLPLTDILSTSLRQWMVPVVLGNISLSTEQRSTCRLQMLSRTGAVGSENFCSPIYCWSPW